MLYGNNFIYEVVFTWVVILTEWVWGLFSGMVLQRIRYVPWATSPGAATTPGAASTLAPKSPGAVTSGAAATTPGAAT